MGAQARPAARAASARSPLVLAQQTLASLAAACLAASQHFHLAPLQTQTQPLQHRASLEALQQVCSFATSTLQLQTFGIARCHRAYLNSLPSDGFAAECFRFF